MRSTRILFAGLSLLLAGCGEAPASNDSAAANLAGNAAAAADDLPRPGTYSVKLIDEFIGSDDPQTKTSEKTYRFTADQFSSGYWIATALEGDQCRERHLTIRDGDISGGMRCDFADLNLVDATVDLHGNYTKDGWDLTIDLSSDGITQRRDLTVRRVGD